MKWKWIAAVAALVVVATVVVAALNIEQSKAILARVGILPASPDASAKPAEDDHDHGEEIKRVKLTEQARLNLKLRSQRLAISTFLRTVELPGLIVDRPGVSDRGVVAPISGTIVGIHAFPGDQVLPGAKLFTIRLVSESLHASQLELFKATREIEIFRRDRERLAGLATSGALPQSRIIEIDNQIMRMEVAVEAYEQDLASRGVAKSDIQAAARGDFLTEITVFAPLLSDKPQLASAPSSDIKEDQPHLEVESLEVELGKQVSAGEVLCHLADHRQLLVEGQGFRSDLQLIREVAGNQRDVSMDVSIPTTKTPLTWPTPLKIARLASDLDPQSRTFAFYLPLENNTSFHEWDETTKDQILIRPGMRVRLRLPLAPIENVIVVPRDAVVESGGDAFIFRQNGDWFEQLSTTIVAEDRHAIALAVDGAVRPNTYIAANHAASLLRILKAQASSGEPSGVHVHADGSVHGSH